VEIQLATERLFVLEDRLSAADAEQRAVGMLANSVLDSKR